MTKYYEGSFYLNYYLDGLAGIIGVFIAQPIYTWLKVRLSFIISLSFTLVFVLLLFLFQEHHLPSKWIESCGAPESPYPEESAKDHEFHLKTIVPIVVFVLKLFINITFLNVYQASMNEELIFPFYNRATSTGIANFVGRLITVFAPLVAELPRPAPAIFLLSINAIALFSAFFLPSKKEQDLYSTRYIQKI